ncbi:stringent starvation protein A [Ruegeria denitrificans]|uniref:Stringent starvation protein A n=1 Tax=Ruegeria denitrificans TaxID=1715692 RepID=A0A0P1IDX4_9RHOB|nr:glutathione S-transferase family protein [Ruegeria denitrificans]CUK07435.1 stringent starvation protein A [Ruegeria denitrificans]
MIRIISFKICPFVQRVTALLEAKQVPYQIDFISLSDKPDWFLELSPTGQVPVLVTEGGTPLFESDAIAEYLDEVAAPLQPDLTPEQRALNRAWSYQASKHYLVQCSTMQSADSAVFGERVTKLNAAFAKAEKQLGNGPFFAGETLGNVDMAWLPLLHRAAIVADHSGHDMLADYPKVKAWQRALQATGIPQKSVSDDFHDRFTDFYLAERTWLGRGANVNEAPSATEVKQSGGCCG